MIQPLLPILFAVLLFTPAAALAQPSPRLMFIHTLDMTVHLQVGGVIDAWTLDDNIAVGDLPPGSHVVHVTLNDSRELSKAFLFSSARLAERDGRRYWCVVVRAKAATAGDDDIVLLAPEDCQRQLAALDTHR